MFRGNFASICRTIELIGVEDSQGNRIADKSLVLKIWEYCITELYDGPNRPETLEVEPEEDVDTDHTGHLAH
jgi:hypothetical protein